MKEKMDIEMTETTIEYLIETRIKLEKDWSPSDYKLDKSDKSNLEKAKQLIYTARDTHEITLATFPTIASREYRLVKVTTTFEILDD